MRYETKKGYVVVDSEDTEHIIQEIVVNPEYRGQGYGQKLLEKAIKWHKTNNKKGEKVLSLCAYALDAHTNTDELVAWYESNGFGIVDDYEDGTIGRCVIMEY